MVRVDCSLIMPVSDDLESVSCIHDEKKGFGWLLLDWIRGKLHFNRTISLPDRIHSSVAEFRALGYLPDYLPSYMLVWNGSPQTAAMV